MQFFTLKMKIIVYMYKMYLALNNYNGWYAIKTNQTKPNLYL